MLVIIRLHFKSYSIWTGIYLYFIVFYFRCYRRIYKFNRPTQMTRHGKNCTAGSVYTYNERQRDSRESGFGSKETRLGRDSRRVRIYALENISEYSFMFISYNNSFEKR